MNWLTNMMIVSLIMVIAFQNAVMTLRALLTRVIASLTVLIAFHWPHPGM